MATYQEFLTELKGTIANFISASEDGADNKTSALAARKASMKLSNDLKDFRKISIDHDKSKSKPRQKKEEAAA